MTPSPAFDLNNPPEGQGPVVKLVALMLRECVSMGAPAARLGRVEGENIFLEVYRDGNWTDMMAFTGPVYEALVAQLRSMATMGVPGMAPEQGLIRALWGGEQRRIGLSEARSSTGPERIELTFGEGVHPAV